MERSYFITKWEAYRDRYLREADETQDIWSQDEYLRKAALIDLMLKDFKDIK